MVLMKAACDWIQLPIVEPDTGKTKLKYQPHKQEYDFQLQSPEEEKTVTVNPTSKFNSNISTNQSVINKSFKHNITSIPSRNYETNLKNDHHVTSSKVTFVTSNSRVSAPYDAMQNQYGTEEITTEWPYESLIETEATNVHMPHMQVHLKTNLNSLIDEQGNVTKIIPQSQADTNTVLPDDIKGEHFSTQETSSTELPLDMLKAVHQTLIQKTPQTIQGKMQFLEQLQNKMLSYMEKRALMSISFLIFAVFLIKLVQQLIQSLQGNNMAAMMMRRRQSRSVPDLLTTARVLQLIDEFPFLHAVKGKSS
ncbi:hypothetical protein L9F63_004991 [Diploptera punctata]|uniref:Uncharacterized protein n=1 Tax=Diploptera punctata TaxID=6984 RepID=A0AAD7ZF57_DIPPU|nr:hypothetical protein L9F63_004991 [Diploptera punctata]